MNNRLNYKSNLCSGKTKTEIINGFYLAFGVTESIGHEGHATREI